MTGTTTHAEVRDNLTRFAARWDKRQGREREEAQHFLLELLTAYGVDTEAPEFTFEHRYPDGTRADLLWPGFLLVEMKSATEADRLSEHRAQALAYRTQSAAPEQGIPAPHWLVLCAFSRFEIWEPGDYPAAPRATVELTELPDRLEVLDFLRGRKAVFDQGAIDLAGEAVAAVGELHRSLILRGIAPELARDFTLQATWCMFAEDLELLPEQQFSGAIRLLRANHDLSSYDQLGLLFEWLSTAGERPAGGMYAGIPYANGELFVRPARIELDPVEVDMLERAARADWSRVEPSIFGGLLQGSLGTERQYQTGAHYTPEGEIQKLVQPTIVEPWLERIDAVETPAEAVDALRDLADFTVLDPACGCGNFLYVAYRELRGIETTLRELAADLHRASGRSLPQDLPRFSLSNMHGIEIDPFAVLLARVTLWIGHKLAVDRYGIDEDVLPLPDLSTVVQGDALRLEWPSADAIVGNPPFHGDRLLRAVVGDEEIEWLKRTFGIGVKDYCVYWFRKTHDHLAPGQRAGLVGTNSISQNRGRKESLGYVVERGGVITDAVSTQVWPGEAKVHVSLVNWVKTPAVPPTEFAIDGERVAAGISPSLRPADLAVDTAAKLQANVGRAFIGPVINGEGFLISEEKARELLANGPEWRDVIRPYLVGEDIVRRPDQAPSRWVIDFGFRTLEEAMRFPGALEIVQRLVKPHRDSVRRETYRVNWWRFAEPIRLMRQEISPLSRYIASPAQGKRMLYTWQDTWTCPSNLTIVFAFDDDYSMGILSSSIHGSWAWAQSSTLKSDIRYTPTTVFATFPWPEAGDDAREHIAAATSRLLLLRGELCGEHGIGLTELYNRVDLGAHRELSQLHRELDTAVAAAYGWPASIVDDTDAMNARLLDLNKRIAGGTMNYAPFRSPDELALL